MPEKSREFSSKRRISNNVIYYPITLDARETKHGRFPFIVYTRDGEVIEDIEVYDITLHVIDDVSNETMSALMFPAEKTPEKANAASSPPRP